LALRQVLAADIANIYADEKDQKQGSLEKAGVTMLSDY
jgi:hypothetical protein